MSAILPSNLPAVNDPMLKTVSIPRELKTTSEVWSTFTEYHGFCKEVVIRNYSPSNIIRYRTVPGDVYQAIPPLAERNVQGWLVLIDLKSDNARAMSGTVITELWIPGT